MSQCLGDRSYRHGNIISSYHIAQPYTCLPKVNSDIIPNNTGIKLAHIALRWCPEGVSPAPKPCFIAVFNVPLLTSLKSVQRLHLVWYKCPLEAQSKEPIVIDRGMDLPPTVLLYINGPTMKIYLTRFYKVAAQRSNKVSSDAVGGSKKNPTKHKTEQNSK